MAPSAWNEKFMDSASSYWISPCLPPFLFFIILIFLSLSAFSTQYSLHLILLGDFLPLAKNRLKLFSLSFSFRSHKIRFQGAILVLSLPIIWIRSTTLHKISLLRTFLPLSLQDGRLSLLIWWIGLVILEPYQQKWTSLSKKQNAPSPTALSFLCRGLPRNERGRHRRMLNICCPGLYPYVLLWPICHPSGGYEITRLKKKRSG